GIRGFHVTGVQTCALPIYSLVAHRDSVRDGDGAEFQREASGLVDAFLGGRTETLQRHVAGGDLVPRGRDRDLRLHPVIVAHADEIGRASCRERGWSAGGGG